MLTAFIRFGDGSISTDTDEPTLLRAVRDQRASFWLDMDQPDDNELALLDDIFGFHPLAIEDTIQYNQRPKIESYNHIGDMNNSGYFYMVIHGPDLTSFKEKLKTKELDIFLSERYLVTIHEHDMTSIGNAIARAQAATARVLDGGVDMLLHYILDQVVDHYVPIFDCFQEEIDTLEEQAITNPTQSLLIDISAKKRELVDLRRVIGPQRDVISQLTRGDVPFIREQTRVYLRDVLDHLVRAVETIEIYRDLVLGARDIYLSSVSNNLNTIMKTLTLVTLIAAVLNVVTGFWGMNFTHIPGLESVAAFWGTVLVMLAVVLGCVWLFRRMRWI